MTNIYVWPTFLFDQHFCLTNIYVWPTFLFDHHLCLTNIYVWPKFMLDQHLCLTNIGWRVQCFDPFLFNTVLVQCSSMHDYSTGKSTMLQEHWTVVCKNKLRRTTIMVNAGIDVLDYMYYEGIFNNLSY